MSEISMSREEREAFLADTHVGVFSVAEEGGRAPLSIPVWYRYERGGSVCFVTPGDSRKVALLRKAGRATLVAQTETLPYKYVTIEGPVTISSELDRKREIDEVAYRYLGREIGDKYLEFERSMALDNVLVSIKPERWASADFGKLGLG
jgi:nitroimidazol reductase NimA-like FMN-containing flavoprotein (pyridoxamine 5'-phosphate oxidase superfamily)